MAIEILEKEMAMVIKSNGDFSSAQSEFKRKTSGEK